MRAPVHYEKRIIPWCRGCPHRLQKACDRSGNLDALLRIKAMVWKRVNRGVWNSKRVV
jgi:hypothetical protein